MAEVFYPGKPATDGPNMEPVPGAIFEVFEIADQGTWANPLSVRIGAGNPSTTVEVSTPWGTVPDAWVDSPNYEHIWKSGTFEWRRDSIDGAKKAIEDAKLAASNSASASDASAVSAANSAQAAQDAAALVDAPADTTIQGLINTEGSATRTALSATFARTGTKGLYVDVTAGPYNAKGDGTTDDYAAINQAAIDVEAAGGGTVFLPHGNYRTSAYLRPRNFVRYQGVGIGRTVIKPYQSAAFTGHGTLASPIESPEWFDMSWDGADIPSTNSLKGQFSEFLRNAHWERVECKNFTATGFGSDFLPGGRYINCIASGNGRGQAVHDPGMSGFGIGTGKYDVEDLLVQGCIAFGNTNYGIFVEKQGSNTNAPYYSKGVRIIGNYTSGNAWGIGGCGVEGAIYSDNICANNSWDGITLHEGTGLAPLGQPDKRAIIKGNHCYGNGRDGINIDYEKNSVSANGAYHVISGNNIHSNSRDGLRLVGSKWASDIVRGIKIHGNLFSRNLGEGIHVVTAAGAEAGARLDDLHIEDNDVRASGLNGIRLGENLIRPVVRGNICYDDQTTRTQVYGILTDVGHTITDGTVQGNTLVQNKTDAAKFDATWAGYTMVTGNKGYYPAWSTITLPGTSPLTYTAGVTPEMVYFAGTVTSAGFKPRPAGGYIPLGAGGSGIHTFQLEPGDTVEVSYTGTPSGVKTIRRQ